MPTSTLQPMPTVPWQFLPAAVCKYLAPIRVLVTKSKGGHAAISFLCQIPRGRYALVTYSPLPGARLDRMTLLPKDLSVEQAYSAQEDDLADWARALDLPMPRPVVADEAQFLARTVLDRVSMQTTWGLCDFGPESPQDYEVWTGTTLNIPVAETAALALHASASPVVCPELTQTLRRAFFNADIEFLPGFNPAVQAVECLAELLGLISERLPEGARELAQYLKARPRRPVVANLADLLKLLPPLELHQRQAVIDHAFRVALTKQQRQGVLLWDTVYEGPLPTRYPLVHMLADLLLPCMDSFLSWAGTER